MQWSTPAARTTFWQSSSTKTPTLFWSTARYVLCSSSSPLLLDRAHFSAAVADRDEPRAEGPCQRIGRVECQCGSTAAACFWCACSPTPPHPTPAPPIVCEWRCCTTDRRFALLRPEDFAYFTENTPGAFFFLGGREPGRSNATCHSTNFDFNDKMLPLGVRVWLELVRQRFGVASFQ